MPVGDFVIGVRMQQAQERRPFHGGYGHCMSRRGTPMIRPSQGALVLALGPKRAKALQTCGLGHHVFGRHHLACT
eukprot:scaffold170147_cov50-Prasinocladus_malaysianus.AAC.3